MILKTINENDTMLDLIINVKQNIEFYIKNRNLLADLKWTNQELILYINELNLVIDMYKNNIVPKWFSNYKAYLFMSSNFPYINPYLSFCFSFKDFVDILLMIGKKCYDSKKEYIFKKVEYIDSESIIPILVNVTNNNDIKCERYFKKDWIRLKNNFK